MTGTMHTQRGRGGSGVWGVTCGGVYVVFCVRVGDGGWRHGRGDMGVETWAGGRGTPDFGSLTTRGPPGHVLGAPSVVDNPGSVTHPVIAWVGGRGGPCARTLVPPLCPAAAVPCPPEPTLSAPGSWRGGRRCWFVWCPGVARTLAFKTVGSQCTPDSARAKLRGWTGAASSVWGSRRWRLPAPLGRWSAGSRRYSPSRSQRGVRGVR